MSEADAAVLAGPSFTEFRSAGDLHRTLADEIVARLSAAVARRGAASFVVPGGTTPGPFYDVLSQREAPWADVTVVPSDERWTERGSERSNEHLTRTRLMRSKAAGLRLVPFKTAHAAAKDAEDAVQDAVAAAPRPFDVVLLGMGNDGHTASLIPGASGLAGALDTASPALVRAISPPDLAALGERMTLTLRALLDARWIVLLIRGEAKRAAYERAMAGTDILAAPVRAVLRQSGTPVSVYWSA
ncbi:MAG TPA: 6-phosphogluconolactonase [Rhizomicrobium sp.]